MAWKAPGERLVTTEARNAVEYVTYLRHLFAYETARQFIESGSDVLDVGCGIGYGTARLAEVAERVVGLDVAAEAIAAANLGPHRSDRCTFRQYDGKRLPFDDGTFDTVISFQVIEHVREDEAYLAEIRRVLKPGGRFLVSTPNKAMRVAPGRKHWWRYHVREYTPAEFRDVLNRTFPRVEVLGVRATERIENIERSRMRMARTLARIDPLDLRRFAPPFIVRGVNRVMAASHRKTRSDDFRATFSVSDYRLISEDIDRAIDLFAVCDRDATSS